MHDLLDQLLRLLVIHGIDFADSAFVRLLESLILTLELFEVLSEGLVFLGQVDVLLLMGALLIHKPFLDVTNERHRFTLLFTQQFGRRFVYFLALSKHAVIELQLLVVKLKNCLHILHTLLQCLHFFLQLNLLVDLLVSIPRT